MIKDVYDEIALVSNEIKMLKIENSQLNEENDILKGALLKLPVSLRVEVMAELVKRSPTLASLFRV